MNVIQTFFFLNYSLKTAVTKSALTNLSNYFYYLIYVDDDDYSFKKISENRILNLIQEPYKSNIFG